MTNAAAEPVLAVESIDVFYGEFQALFGVTIEIPRGGTVSVIGANGAGKTTLLRTIAGALAPRHGRISYRGAPIAGVAAHRLAGRGITLVPEGRCIFPSLSVEENLLVGGHSRRIGRFDLPAVYDIFPALRDRRRRPATELSGGEQQMLAIGRALMANPDVVLLDEISLGLAPVVIRDIYARLPRLAAEGLTMVVVEQDVTRALRVADRVYCLQEGRVSLAGKPADFTHAQITLAYFGAPPTSRAP